MKHFYPILSVALSALFAFTACDTIDFEDRLDGPIEVEVGKNILIEDYTGQKCANCPLAHAEAEKLQELYGKDKIIAVAIHGGPQAVDEGNSVQVGLANETGKEYNRRLGSFAYPKGIVDRQGGLSDYEKWNTSIVSRLTQKSPVNLSVQAIEVDEPSRFLSFTCKVESRQAIDGQLQVWLTESNIQAVQALPAQWGGGYQSDYVHNHVFRAAVNGIDGISLSLGKDESANKNYAYTLADDWNIRNMHLVIFYYNETDGVLQVIETPLVQPNP